MGLEHFMIAILSWASWSLAGHQVASYCATPSMSIFGTQRVVPTSIKAYSMSRILIFEV
jgi:hypothetical protein